MQIELVVQWLLALYAVVMILFWVMVQGWRKEKRVVCFMSCLSAFGFIVLTVWLWK